MGLRARIAAGTLDDGCCARASAPAPAADIARKVRLFIFDQLYMARKLLREKLTARRSPRAASRHDGEGKLKHALPIGAGTLCIYCSHLEVLSLPV